MKIRPWYPIKYEYFISKRFNGDMIHIVPSSLELIKTVQDPSTDSTSFIDSIIRVSNKEAIKNELSSLKPSTEVNYTFTLENGILIERIDGTHPHNRIKLTTHLNKEKQNVFLNNIFNYFGFYLTVYIKHHDGNALNGQHYILNEFKKLLAKHTLYSTSCGDYTFIHNASEDINEYLGIDAALDRNPLNELDERMGITLSLYRDDETKSEFNSSNFTIKESNVKYFSNYKAEHINICNAVLSALDKSNVEYDLIYNLFEKNN